MPQTYGVAPGGGARAAQPATAAATTFAIPASPRALGWNGAAGLVGISGSTHFTSVDLHAPWPTLAV